MYPAFQFYGENQNSHLVPFANLAGKVVNRFRVSKSHAHVKNFYHKHDYFQIWYMNYGQCIHHINGTDFLQTKGDLIIIPPFLSHYLDTTNSLNIELICVEFSEQFIDDAVSDISKTSLFNLIYLEPLVSYAKDAHPILHFEGSVEENICHVLSNLFDEYVRQDKFFSTLVRSDMTKLLTLIVRQYEMQGSIEKDALFAKYRVSIQDALKYIDNNFTQKLYLNDVCKKALMSPSSFSYIFKNITGKTLVEYLNYLRVLRASDLLCKTDKTILEIGLECGFRDAINFSRVFKKFTGYQPSTYRKLYAHI